MRIRSLAPTLILLLLATVPSPARADSAGGCISGPSTINVTVPGFLDVPPSNSCSFPVTCTLARDCELKVTGEATGTGLVGVAVYIDAYSPAECWFGISRCSATGTGTLAPGKTAQLKCVYRNAVATTASITCEGSAS